MRSKVGIALAVTALFAVTAVAVATASTDSTRGAAAQAAPAKAKCASLKFGFAGALTGPAASIGQQQLSWAKFAVSQWNAKNKT